ncbi:MAG: HAMP domain-containing histidine kinase [Clostridia bacterium]|nr:HAMP domain-containing histidine kinase [Clostridia bacterium]
MKFREKTYLITLVLFLIFLNAGIFSLAYYTHERATDSEESLCRAEQSLIVKAFEQDAEYTGRHGKLLLMHTYGSHYDDDNVFLCFTLDGNEQFNNLPEGVTPPKESYAATQRVNGKRYYLITERVCNEYIFTYAKDVSYLDSDFKSMSTVFVSASLVASAILAIILFFVLRRLSLPLERLKNTTAEIAQGNFDIRADDSGKDEFSLLASDVNKMSRKVREQFERLEENAESKQMMLDNLAHEMRTPLTSIRGYAEYIINAKIDEHERQEAAEYIISEAERLRLIGERLLDEAFIRENGIVPEQTDISELIHKAEKTLSPKASEKGVTITTAADKITVNCDPLLIGLVITNLADNAIKACRENGRVELGCRKEENNVIISVADNGIGMTAEQAERITEPFYRTDKSRARSDGGTGLGLSLCDKIVKAHGAKLVFSSQLGKGTTAFVIFTNS